MQVILVHHRLAQARTLTLSGKHFALAAFLFIALVLICSLLLYYLTFRHAADVNIPVVRNLLLSATQDQEQQKDRYVRENLNAMAAKLGEMQAQLMRLEALGERVSGLAGIKPQEFNFKEAPGRGGISNTARDITMEEFSSQLDRLSSDLEHRSDYLNVVETELMSATLKSKMMPTIQPVDVSYNASGFGMRIDPFGGGMEMHQGVDFVAPTGTPIVAAAGGVVIVSEWHHDFGNMIVIDHGNDISTLYGHASRVYVKVGDIVHRSQHIADIGTTGHSTGPHLHFEVHVKGIPQNPSKFLQAASTPTMQVASAAGHTVTPAALPAQRPAPPQTGNFSAPPTAQRQIAH